MRRKAFTVRAVKEPQFRKKKFYVTEKFTTKIVNFYIWFSPDGQTNRLHMVFFRRTHHEHMIVRQLFQIHFLANSRNVPRVPSTREQNDGEVKSGKNEGLIERVININLDKYKILYFYLSSRRTKSLTNNTRR